MYIYKYMYFFKCANVSKFFFFKTQHIVELNKECFWFMNFSQISIFQFEYLIV